MKIEEFKAVVATMGLYLVVEETPDFELHQLHSKKYSAVVIDDWWLDTNGEVSGPIVAEGLGHTRKSALKKLKENMLYGNR